MDVLHKRSELLTLLTIIHVWRLLDGIAPVERLPPEPVGSRVLQLRAQALRVGIDHMLDLQNISDGGPGIIVIVLK